MIELAAERLRGHGERVAPAIAHAGVLEDQHRFSPTSRITRSSLGAETSTEYSDTTVDRPSLPNRAAKRGSRASDANARRHASMSSARRPFTPSFTMSRFAPTGLATAGTPQAMYWRGFVAGFPRDHGSPGTGTRPSA